MILTGKFKVLRVKKKTSAQFFKDLKAGDEFQLVYSLSGHYNSAPTIDIYQNNGEWKHRNNALQLSDNLSKFSIEQLQ